ncbi:hypothetical protein U1Q18_003935 [Sarracenia purpurea var. burkii]
MSSSIEQQQQPPPPLEVMQQVYTVRSGHGSIGPVIGVLAVITILGAIAVMIGRLCSGRRIMGHGQYDFEGWVEAKCASCIDGRVYHPSPPSEPPPTAAAESTSSNVARSGSDAIPASAAPTEAVQEAEEEEITHRNQRERTES